MAGAFTAVDLSKLPFPGVVETLDYEAILAQMLADLRERAPAFDALVESDPAYKILEVAAFREMLLRQRVNEAAKAVMLAYAEDTDLDQIAANYNVERLLIEPADPSTVPPTEAVYESDADLRRRVQLAYEGFSTAGPAGAYYFHALGADSDVRDVGVYGPPTDPGTVHVAVLSRTGNGQAPTDLVQKVQATLSAEDIRPLSDTVICKSAQILEYEIRAVLTFYNGPDAQVVLQAALAAVTAYTEQQHRIGRDVTLSGIYAALHQEGVQNVALLSPAANVVAEWDQAAYCTGITLTPGGSNG